VASVKKAPFGGRSSNGLQSCFTTLVRAITNRSAERSGRHSPGSANAWGISGEQLLRPAFSLSRRSCAGGFSSPPILQFGLGSADIEDPVSVGYRSTAQLAWTRQVLVQQSTKRSWMSIQRRVVSRRQYISWLATQPGSHAPMAMRLVLTPEVARQFLSVTHPNSNHESNPGLSCAGASPGRLGVGARASLASGRLLGRHQVGSLEDEANTAAPGGGRSAQLPRDCSRSLGASTLTRVAGQPTAKRPTNHSVSCPPRVLPCPMTISPGHSPILMPFENVFPCRTVTERMTSSPATDDYHVFRMLEDTSRDAAGSRAFASARYPRSSAGIAAPTARDPRQLYRPRDNSHSRRCSRIVDHPVR